MHKTGTYRANVEELVAVQTATIEKIDAGSGWTCEAGKEMMKVEEGRDFYKRKVGQVGQRKYFVGTELLAVAEACQ